MAYDNTNSGALFKNDKKTADNPNWADYTGKINVAGVDYWLSAWIKDGKSGKFMSLSIKPQQAPAAAKPEPKRNSDVSGFDPDTDEIPF